MEIAPTAISAVDTTAINNVPAFEGPDNTDTAIDIAGTFRRSSQPFKHQCAVGAAKTEGIFHRIVNFHIPRSIGAVIEIALGILIENIDCRRRNMVMER